MDMKEVERRISHYLILYEGKELTRRQTIVKILHIQLAEGKVCDDCDGKGGWAGSNEYPEPLTKCEKCKGTGKLPVTIEDVIKKCQEG